MDRSVKERRKPNPWDRANILSQVTFSYTLNIFRKAFKKDLDDEDLYEVVKSCESKKWGNRMENKWNQLKKKDKHPSIYKLMWACFGRTYLLFGLVHFVWKMSNSVLEPEAMSRLISYFKPDKDISKAISKDEAFIYAGVLIGLKFLHCFYQQNYQVYLQTFAVQIKTSFCSMIYRKALKLTPSAFLDISLGNIVTLVTKDIQTFDMCLWLLNDLWIAIIQTIVICYLIYSKMGYSSFIGIAILFFSMPLQIFIGKIVGRMRLKINSKTDERLQITQESLSAIKIIKMYVWEKFFEVKVADARQVEVNHLLKIFYLKMLIMMLGIFCSKIGFLMLIMVYAWLGNMTTPAMIYYAYTHFHTLQHSIGIIMPMGLARVAEVSATFTRLNRVLLADELKQVKDDEEFYPVKNPKIELKNVSVNIKTKEAIRDVTLTLNPGLTVVTGHLGCGKSSLLKTILHDYPMNSGDMRIQGRMAYASQDPWLFPASIKENILFGQDYDERKYKQVIRACALEFDFDLFENRDETIVSDRGLNLSKGQQARINLARAVYKDSEIYLLDDSLTALDPRVQEYIFKELMQGYLRNKHCICVLVTHNPQHIQAADKLVILDNGTVKFSGATGEISPTEVKKFIDDDFQDAHEVKGEEPPTPGDEKSCLLESDVEVRKNIYREVKKKGSVNFGVYWQYVRFGGGILLFSFIMFMYGITQVSESYSQKQLSKWVNFQSSLTDLANDNLTGTSNYTEAKAHNDFTLNIYSGITVGNVLLELFKYYMFLRFATQASIKIHKKMINTIINAIMSFFDSYFIGNILNRFSQDLNCVDEHLPHIITHCFSMMFRCVGMVIVIASVNWRFMFPSIGLLVALVGLRVIYMPAGRSLKRLEAASRSPMVGHMNASLEGITTIRAYKAQNILRDEFDRHQDLFTSANFTSFCMKRAFGFYMDIFSVIFISIIILRFLIVDTGTSPGEVGLAITQGLGLSQLIQWTLMQWAELENLMTSLERLLEYTTLPQESKDGQRVPNWPNKGTVEFQKVGLTYAKSHKQVLKNINFSLAPKEMIGIVGRTGAGKSSIISTLFRLYNFEGKILVDGVDTKTLSLDFLREGIAIIPQDPVLFSGTIRSNMDPLDKYKDNDIWKALDNVYMRSAIDSLDMTVGENDSIFSTGQRQLICVARAILRKNKVVVLDEATANMDPETENLIQKTIQENFSDCTVLIIAHRLQSVLTCNKVMVMDKGEIIELDDPMVLLENKNGTFYMMVKQAGLLGSLD